ncbi:UPF0738 family protein [Bacillus massilinigeriensis]|uniref:UPF0738 family protein n=1 Tax=Bacillus massilionigeriensis TaxID=1805475 RepID=UPI00096B132F|nr:hypothetical protein [Bacillus massilionigeriensis]
MRQQVKIKTAVFLNDELIFNTDQTIHFKNIKATGQMLVDSNAFSFIYIMEIDQSYTYLVFPEHIWTDLRKMLEIEIPVFIKLDEWKVELSNIHNELQYLIENIKGNRNYGEEMVQKVESTF